MSKFDWHDLSSIFQATMLSNFNLRAPDAYLVPSYLIATVMDGTLNSDCTVST